MPVTLVSKITSQRRVDPLFQPVRLIPGELGSAKRMFSSTLSFPLLKGDVSCFQASCSR